MTVVFKLRVVTPKRPLENTDIYITIRNSKVYSYKVETTRILWLGGSPQPKGLYLKVTAWGKLRTTVLYCLHKVKISQTVYILLFIFYNVSAKGSRSIRTGSWWKVSDLALEPWLAPWSLCVMRFSPGYHSVLVPHSLRVVLAGLMLCCLDWVNAVLLGS